MKYNIYAFVWDSLEIIYKYTRLRPQVIVEYFYPEFGPWLFGKMIGVKGVKGVKVVKKEKENE